MELLFILLIALPVCGYYLFVGIFDNITGYKKEEKYNFEPDNITHVHHHHNTHNHLHVDKEDLSEMIGNSKESNS
ncbi:hypothetical protein Danklef1_12 [Polaribacter phage Danklef_1]|uniref:Uncharacterized protein n=1 Tax=Polaribacter phage Danklef_1 TaxID=2745646 RepID=A0A8E5EAX0_9CAUD|nr:hypothetical protein M1M23_gp12 [Polaribacter phage Danklef_1]QQV90491.1 hypothetical protein Danklef1_12 [Polaribacter phage Danklef_1]QQV90568.1 hypothetical protein Danklef2_13 [Polaribacter phage Danklef_2]